VRAVRLAGIVGLAAVAVLAIVLARDVRAWRSSLESGDAVYATNPAGASWRPSTHLGGLAGDLLEVDRQARFREALQLYRRAARVPARLDNARSVAALRDRAQKALATAARDPDPQRASQALTLLGILAFGAVAQGGGQLQLDAAASDFTDAIRTHPANEPAKFDLELLLRSAAAHGVQVRPGTGGGFGRSGRRGAGGGVTGRGY
jgi:hypothetical protein